MTPKARRILKWSAFTLGALVVLVIALGAYVYSILPKSVGTPPVLQAELFRPPPQEEAVAERYRFKSASDLAAMIRNREASSEDIVKEFIAYIKHNNYRLSLVSLGLLARTPEDLEVMWNVLRDTKIDERFQHRMVWQPPTGRSIAQYRVAWMDEWAHGGGIVKVGRDVKEKLGALVDQLGRSGVALEHTAPDTYDEMVRSFLGSYASMMSEGQPWLMRRFIKVEMCKMDDGSANFQAFNAAIDDASDDAWQRIQQNRKRLTDIWDVFFRTHDFFLLPVTYGPAFKKGIPSTPLDADAGKVAYIDYIPYSYVFNATGHPSLTIPLGLNKDGLPIAVQVVGGYNSEPELLRFARLLEVFTPGFVKPRLF